MSLKHGTGLHLHLSTLSSVDVSVLCIQIIVLTLHVLLVTLLSTLANSLNSVSTPRSSSFKVLVYKVIKYYLIRGIFISIT